MKNNIVILLFVAMTLALLLSMKECSSRGESVNRLSGNQRSLMSDIAHYQIKDSINVAGVERLRLTNNEFSRYNSALKSTIDDLKIKIGRLQSVSNTAIASNYNIVSAVKDTVVVYNNTIDSIRCIHHKDPYITFDGCIYNKQFTGTIETKDTIVQVIHRVPKQWWFFKWGTKAIRQEVLSKNPHSRIVFTEYIELEN